MDDRFLYENRPPLRPGFGEGLYARIRNAAERTGMPGRFLRIALQVGLACLLGLGGMMTFSQPARASVLDWIRKVAGLEVLETNTISSAGGAVAVPPDSQGSLTQVLPSAPFAFALPAYVPDGFTFEDRVDVHDESIFMRWLNREGAEILMQVDTDHGQRYLMGVDAAREIQINRESALLARGGYDIDGTWNPALNMINIIQRRDELVYWLIYVGNSQTEFEAGAIQDELARMIGSIP